MTIFVIWQLRVTLDSIRNSCDIFKMLSAQIINKKNLNRNDISIFVQLLSVQGRDGGGHTRNLKLQVKFHLYQLVSSPAGAPFSFELRSTCYHTPIQVWGSHVFDLHSVLTKKSQQSLGIAATVSNTINKQTQQINKPNKQQTFKTNKYNCQAHRTNYISIIIGSVGWVKIRQCFI